MASLAEQVRAMTDSEIATYQKALQEEERDRVRDTLESDEMQEFKDRLPNMSTSQIQAAGILFAQELLMRGKGYLNVV